MAFEDTSLPTALAAHRFGLGEARLDALGDDPRGWLAGQIGPADTAIDVPLEATDNEREKARAQALADRRSRVLTALATRRPFAERLAWFWANHCTVSTAKNSARGRVGGFECEAIRPHIAGSFGRLLEQAVTHPAMLHYLDNQNSAGPGSRRARRRPAGLNENLAREVLELHTLGVHGGYGQADVVEFARLLTGWRGQGDAAFDPAWHEPGPKTVLGKTYPEGPQALGLLLHDLARHPSTARFVSTKLARHFVADEPPPAVVDRLAAAWRRSEGDLPSVYHALLESPEAWSPRPAKLKSPEELVISTARCLGLGARLPVDVKVDERQSRTLLNAAEQLGQRVQAAPSPAGWSDRAEDWLGPDAVWKRVEWMASIAEHQGVARQLDAGAIARSSLGPLLQPATALQMARAADRPQALTLLFMSPEFQRR